MNRKVGASCHSLGQTLSAGIKSASSFAFLQVYNARNSNKETDAVMLKR